MMHVQREIDSDEYVRVCFATLHRATTKKGTRHNDAGLGFRLYASLFAKTHLFGFSRIRSRNKSKREREKERTCSSFWLYSKCESLCSFAASIAGRCSVAAMLPSLPSLMSWNGPFSQKFEETGPKKKKDFHGVH